MIDVLHGPPVLHSWDVQDADPEHAESAMKLFDYEIPEGSVAQDTALFAAFEAAFNRTAEAVRGDDAASYTREVLAVQRLSETLQEACASGALRDFDTEKHWGLAADPFCKYHLADELQASCLPTPSRLGPAIRASVLRVCTLPPHSICSTTCILLQAEELTQKDCGWCPSWGCPAPSDDWGGGGARSGGHAMTLSVNWRNRWSRREG